MTRIGIAYAACAVLLFAGTGSVSAGGAWTLEKNEISVGFNTSALFYTKIFNRTDPKTSLNRQVYDATINVNLEYGLTGKLTLSAEFPYKLTGTADEIEESGSFGQSLPADGMNAFGNLRFGGRYQVVDKESPMSLQLMVEANTSDLNFYTGLQTGTNCWTYYPTLSFGHSFGENYISFDMGLGLRSNDYSESFLGLFEFGGKPGKGNWWLIGVMQVEKAFYNGDYQNLETAQTGLYVNNQEHISYGIKSIIPLKNGLSLNGGLYGSVYGNGVGAFPSVNLGLNWKTRLPKKKSAADNASAS